MRDAFEEALSGILNKRQVDVLHDIQRAKARGRPYVIVFCGVNGVGKSTNLAKICYWLNSHNLKVQLAACDTFRAGAVEQLKTHAMRLGVRSGLGRGEQGGVGCMCVHRGWGLEGAGACALCLHACRPVLRRMHTLLPACLLSSRLLPAPWHPLNPAFSTAPSPSSLHRCRCMSAATRRTPPRWRRRRWRWPSVMAATWCWSILLAGCRCVACAACNAPMRLPCLCIWGDFLAGCAAGLPV